MVFSTHPLGFLGGSEVKNLPAMQETQVRSLDWENPLEKEMATHSSILARRIFWTAEPGGLQSMGSQKSWIQLHLLTHTHTHTLDTKKACLYLRPFCLLPNHLFFPEIPQVTCRTNYGS